MSRSSSGSHATRQHPRQRPLRLAFLPLTDAAPLIAAQEVGFFARYGLNVTLSREVGWATLRDKIIFGELDAAHSLAGLLVSTALGLGSIRCECQTALILSCNGNAITLSSRLRSEGVTDGPSLAREVRKRSNRLVFGVVHPFSSHNLLLRSWFARIGLDPDQDVRIVVVPPAQMCRNLAAGTIDGFCVGEPWNSVSIQDGHGWCPAIGATEQTDQLEKVLIVRRDFADHAEEHPALVASLIDACAYCESPEGRRALPAMLADRRYLALDEGVLEPALSGHFDRGFGRIEDVPHFHVFHGNGTNRPSPARARSLINTFARTNLISPTSLASLEPTRLFREDLHEQARELINTHDTSLV